MAIDLAQLNFDRRYALCIQKIYHRTHFTVGECWNKSFHVQPLQRCYRENSGSSASACLMRCHYSVTYRVTLRNKWFNSCRTRGKLTYNDLFYREYPRDSRCRTRQKTAERENVVNCLGTTALLQFARRYASILFVYRRLQTYMEL